VTTVPNTAVGNYKAKELLQLGAVSINQGASTGLTASGVHVNAYFGDVSGDGVIGAADVNPVFSVTVGSSTGFGPYTLLDPAIIGDVAGDVAVDGGDVAYLKGYILNHASRPKVPVPPGLTGIVSQNAADPTLSLQVNSEPTGVSPWASAASPQLVSVMLDDPHPQGSTGLTEAILALSYDPSALSVSAADITLGSIPADGTGWQIESVIDATKGQIGIVLYSSAPIDASEAGSLVNIAFHVLPGDPRVPPTTTVQLLNTAIPNGQDFTTLLADSQGGLALSLGTDRLELPADATRIYKRQPRQA
jgi:hypothetical protein